MTTKNIRPRDFGTFDAFDSACVHAAIADLPHTSRDNDMATNGAIRLVLLAAIDAAHEDARDRWAAHIEHMEDLYERGVGPAWEGF